MRSVRYYAMSALLVWGIMLMPLPVSSEVKAEEIQAWLDDENLNRHMDHLTRIPRPPATETEFAAGVYVEDTLRSYGYETTLQPFSYYTYRKPSTLSLSIEGWSTQNWNPKSIPFGPNGAATSIIVNSGLGTAADFHHGNARGNIAFIKRGSISFAEKVRQAAAAGAVAAIIWNDKDGEWKGTLAEPLDMSVPVIALPREEGLLIQKRLAAKEQLKATVNVDGGLSSKQTSYNFIASRKPAQGGTGQIVLLTGHHDSVPISPGANHGAAGLSVLLEVARNMSDRPIDTEIRFVSFGAVSSGERGPIAFADSLSAGEKEKIIAAFSLDGVGNQDKGDLLVTTGNGTKNLPANLVVEAGARFSSASHDQVRGNSEFYTLAAAGIPTALVTRPPVNTLRDQPQDTRDKISMAYLTEATQVMFAVISQMTDPSTPAYPKTGGSKLSRKATAEEEFQ
ncbi:M28 family peptidase [Brevibacillus sp. NRS-1366]|uniref:M28 family peptidase n=1 Tax=Brevibacillus sp. NRS-1366 TaxID=3233899 RepID=UPI003D192D79